MTERGCAIRILIAIAPFILWNAPQLLADSTAPASPDDLPGVIDMSAVKCSDLLAMPEERQRLALAWMTGYYSGLANGTGRDRAPTASTARKLVEACKNRGALAVMTVIDKSAMSGNRWR